MKRLKKSDEIVPGCKFLAIRGWVKFHQPEKPGKKGWRPDTKWPWIKDATNREDDFDFGALGFFDRGLLEGLGRARGRTGKNIHNSLSWIAQATHALPTDRPHLRHGILTLVSRGILIPTDQQLDCVEESRIEEKRLEMGGNASFDIEDEAEMEKA